MVVAARARTRRLQDRTWENGTWGGGAVTIPEVKMPDTSWGRKYLTLRGPWDRPYLTIKGKTVPDFVATRFRYGLVGVVQSAVFFNILH